jgi:hypothetical protein
MATAANHMHQHRGRAEIEFSLADCSDLGLRREMPRREFIFAEEKRTRLTLNPAMNHLRLTYGLAGREEMLG